MRILFGSFTVDRGSRQLLCDGTQRHLSPKAFDLLDLLLKHRPHVVHRDRIRDSLWPSTVVTESTVATIVAELRSVLGDDVRRPRWVRTVHRFGYAFCGEAAAGPSEDEPRPRGPMRYRLFLDDREVTLREGDNVLGRVEDGAAWIDSPTVSRRHARIVIAGGRATLHDLDSKNGTFVRGQRIEEAVVLGDGDEIRLGRIRMKFRALPADLTTHTDSER